VHSQRASLRDNESVVLEGFLRTEILGSMDSATNVLECLPYRKHPLSSTAILDVHRTAGHDVEDRTRVIVPSANFAGCQGYRPKRDRARTAKNLGVGNGADGYNDDSCCVGQGAKSNNA